MVRIPAFYAYVLSTLIAAAALLFYVGVIDAKISHYSDTISDSGPLAYSNHTVQFTTMDTINASGFVRFRFAPGEFYMPTTTMDVRNVELYVSEGGGPFILRPATTTATTSMDGVSITYGSNALVEVTLNGTDEIPAGADVRLLIGKHTSGAATTTDTGVQNPDTPGSYPMFIETSNGDLYRPWIAIVEKVNAGPLDTREFEPPFRFNGAPTGLLSGTTQIVELSLRTNEFALCRYSTASGTPYFSMINEFTTGFTIIHPKLVPVASSTSYAFYVRCIDDEGNFNTDDYEIAFTVRPYPEGEPGDTGDDEGQGESEGDNEGTGTGSDGSSSGSDGNPPGPGGGSSGSGGASTGSGSSGSGGGGSSGGSGSGGGGGFESTERPYQSGDGQVIINGYAFPGSTVTILVDGSSAGTTRAGSSGSFSYTIEAIARGVYTFGVYATDRNNIKSSTFTTTFTVTGSRGSTLSNVNVMPTIRLTPDPVTPGANLSVSGYSIPNSTITIENQQEKSSVSLKTFTATSDAQGAWSLEIPTTGFQTGTYKIRAKAFQSSSNISTNWSSFTFYGVGQSAQRPGNTDLNRDGKVNLVDFSILLFWWNSNGGNSNPPADINQDGRVNLTDFSILIFNWTG